MPLSNGRKRITSPASAGQKDNVLARFARAAELLDADVIVRVSSDAPFVDAGFVDHLITSLLEQNGDYVLLEEGAETAHEGVDPFTRRALDKLMMDAGNDRPRASMSPAISSCIPISCAWRGRRLTRNWRKKAGG